MGENLGGQQMKTVRSKYLQRYPDGSIYFRFRGKSLGRLPDAEGSAEFNREYDLLHRQGVTTLSFSDLTANKANLYIQKIKREHGGAAAVQQKTLLSNLWQFAREFPDF